MPRLSLTQHSVRSVTAECGHRKTDYFDRDCKGLMLEVRASGGKTYALRYQNTRGETRQVKLADAADVTLAQARALAAKQRNLLAMGEDPLAKKAEHRQVPTVSEFIHGNYIPFVKSYKRSWKCDLGLLRNHVEPQWGKRRLDEIAKHDVITLITTQRATHAPASCNRLLIVLRYMFNLAVRWEVPGMKADPTAGIRRMEENNKSERYLSREEADRLYQQLLVSENPSLKYIIPMLLLTGARKGEVLEARWEHIDVQRRSWRVPLAKGGKVRYVPLSDGALSLLGSAPRSSSPWVFPNPATGKPYVSFYDSWHTARTRAGLHDVRIHDLRHSFASFLVNSGRSLYEVQKILGHTQASTTQRYAHLSQDSLVSAANEAVKFMTIPRAPTLVVAHTLARPPC